MDYLKNREKYQKLFKLLFIYFKQIYFTIELFEQNSTHLHILIYFRYHIYIYIYIYIYDNVQKKEKNLSFSR